MTYLLWSLPILVIVVAIASGRVGAIGAGFSGALIAVAVACTAAPAPLTSIDVLMSGAKGLWLSWLVAAVILSGLFFRHSITAPSPDVPPPASADTAMTRRRVFSICFLIGPFAEAATGFGVGQVATVAALSALGLALIHVVLLGLFSQILVPWAPWPMERSLALTSLGYRPPSLAWPVPSSASRCSLPGSSCSGAWLRLPSWPAATRSGRRRLPGYCWRSARLSAPIDFWDRRSRAWRRSAP